MWFKGSSRNFGTIVPLITVGAAAAAAFIIVLVIAAHRADDVVRDKETALVANALSGMIAKVVRDQESVALWDDSIENTKLAFDPAWIDLNLGSWMHDFFGVDQTFVLTDANKSVFAMIDGESVDPSYFTLASTAVSPLARKLRSRMKEGVNADDGTPHAADLVVLQGRPAIASVMPLLSDSGKIEQAPGSEYLHVSVRFLDDNYLEDVMRRYLLTGARFAWNDEPAAGEAAFPLTRASGSTLGYFIWTPSIPGWTILTRTAPALALALLAVSAIVALLLKMLLRTGAVVRQREEALRYLAFHDPLTSLASRASFNEALERALKDAERERFGVALLYLDLDGFKRINDTYGHPAGDVLLREVGKRLSELVRGTDFIARLGGDEFAILVTDSPKLADLEALSARIIADVGRPYDLFGKSAAVGVSVGIACSASGGIEGTELIRRADKALYRSKLEGRNRSCVYTFEMDAREPLQAAAPSLRLVQGGPAASSA